MSENHRKPAYYDMPLYQRMFPNYYDFNGREYYKRPQKRDAFEDFMNLYSVFVFYGAVRPNTHSGIYNYWQ